MTEWDPQPIQFLPPPPMNLRPYPVTSYTFEDVHDRHVWAVLDGLAHHHLTPDTAEVALAAMVSIAEQSHYGELP